jgi:hypothetical protein
METKDRSRRSSIDRALSILVGTVLLVSILVAVSWPREEIDQRFGADGSGLGISYDDHLGARLTVLMAGVLIAVLVKAIQRRRRDAISP